MNIDSFLKILNVIMGLIKYLIGSGIVDPDDLLDF